jgi:hypothetical protein
MRILYLHLALAAWLVLSTWLFGYTPESLPVTVGAGVLVAALALVAERRPPVRFGITLVGAALFVGALLLPELSGAERLNLMVVGPALLGLSLVAADPARVARARAARRGLTRVD